MSPSPLPDNPPRLRPRPHRLLHPEHPAGVVLPRQPDPGHRGHGLRRVGPGCAGGVPGGAGTYIWSHLVSHFHTVNQLVTCCQLVTHGTSLSHLVTLITPTPAGREGGHPGDGRGHDRAGRDIGGGGLRRAGRPLRLRRRPGVRRRKLGSYFCPRGDPDRSGSVHPLNPP